MPHRIRSRLLSFLVVFALALSPAFALSGGQRYVARSARAAVATSPMSWVWSTLQRLFGRSGAEMDPDGKPKPASATSGSLVTPKPPATTDSGAEMDPDG